MISLCIFGVVMTTLMLSDCDAFMYPDKRVQVESESDFAQKMQRVADSNQQLQEERILRGLEKRRGAGEGEEEPYLNLLLSLLRTRKLEGASESINREILGDFSSKDAYLRDVKQESTRGSRKSFEGDDLLKALPPFPVDP